MSLCFICLLRLPTMKLHTFSGYIQNIHLVEYPHGCMLLDGCTKVDYDEIVWFFKHTLKRPLSDLKVVMVTHMHPDHAGCAQYLRKKTGARIITGKHNSHWYKGIKGRFAHLADMSLALWVAKRLGKKRKNIWYPAKLNACYTLSDNSRIPDFEDWKVIYTPGHTDRDISLVNDKEKMLYVADLIVKVKKTLAAPFPVYLPKEYKNSLAKILRFEGYSMLMAHVPMITVKSSDIESLIETAPTSPATNMIALQNRTKRLLKRVKLA